MIVTGRRVAPGAGEDRWHVSYLCVLASIASVWRYDNGGKQYDGTRLVQSKDEVDRLIAELVDIKLSGFVYTTIIIDREFGTQDLAHSVNILLVI